MLLFIRRKLSQPQKAGFFSRLKEKDRGEMKIKTNATQIQVEKTLREHAMRRRSESRAWGKTVEGAIRAVLPVIEEVKSDLTWDEIAKVLADAGVAWRTGRPVSGADLRSVVHRLRLRARARSASASPEMMYATPRVDSERSSQRGRLEVLADGTKATGAEGIDRERILREMARAAFERRHSRSIEKGVAADDGGAKMMETHLPGDPIR